MRALEEEALSAEVEDIVDIHFQTVREAYYFSREATTASSDRADL